MTRALLPPIRTRRYTRLIGPSRRPAHDGLSPGTRKTVAAIGALLVSFAFSAAGEPAGGNAPAASADLTSPTD